MVHFTQSDPAELFYSSSQCMRPRIRVTPFGYLRLLGYVLLPAAFRSLSRPSSPCNSLKASTMNLYYAWPYCLSRISTHSRAVALASYYKYAFVSDTSHSKCYCAINLSFPLPVLVKKLFDVKKYIFITPLEIRGLEPLTLGLQSRCSSQLS